MKWSVQSSFLKPECEHSNRMNVGASYHYESQPHFKQSVTLCKHRNGKVIPCFRAGADFSAANLKCKVIAPGRLVYVLCLVYVLYYMAFPVTCDDWSMGSERWLMKMLESRNGGTWLVQLIIAIHLAFVTHVVWILFNQIAWLVIEECNQKATYKSDVSNFMNSFLFTDSTDIGNGHQVVLSHCTLQSAMRILPDYMKSIWLNLYILRLPHRTRISLFLLGALPKGPICIYIASWFAYISPSMICNAYISPSSCFAIGLPDVHHPLACLFFIAGNI